MLQKLAGCCKTTLSNMAFFNKPQRERGLPTFPDSSRARAGLVLRVGRRFHAPGRSVLRPYVYNVYVPVKRGARRSVRAARDSAASLVARRPMVSACTS